MFSLLRETTENMRYTAATAIEPAEQTTWDRKKIRRCTSPNHVQKTLYRCMHLSNVSGHVDSDCFLHSTKAATVE